MIDGRPFRLILQRKQDSSQSMEPANSLVVLARTAVKAGGSIIGYAMQKSPLLRLLARGLGIILYRIVKSLFVGIANHWKFAYETRSMLAIEARTIWGIAIVKVNCVHPTTVVALTRLTSAICLARILMTWL